LHSLEQGGEALATPEEFGAWCLAWPGPGALQLLDARCPRPILRRWALELLRAIPLHAYVRIQQVLAEEAGPSDDLDLERAAHEWGQWRDGLIRHYRLDDFALGERAP
jgi:hypothetical protein